MFLYDFVRAFLPLKVLFGQSTYKKRSRLRPPGNAVLNSDVGSEIKRPFFSRGIYITNRSVLASEKDQLTFLSLPGAAPINLIEINAATGACPKGLQVSIDVT
jgi:hypothetical protein